jgi:hypothetical protein
VSITLAPDTGHVLSAISPWPEGIPQIAPFPLASEEERQLVNRGERFTGLPAFAPSISLLKALQIIEAETPGGANQARQIIAYYIMQKTVRYRERAVWIVQTRGIPPFPTGFDAPVDIPEDARNHLRHTVDAQTGEWLSSDTTPQPVRSRKLSQILNPVLS